MLKLKNIHVKYKNPEGQEFFALKDINLDISEGEYVAILGTSGSGKTTLSNVIGLLNSSYSGEYEFDDIKAHKLSDRKCGKLRSDQVGFIFQDYALIDYLSALDNVALALQYSPLSKKKIYAIASEKLASVGLKDKMHHKPSQLSGGQKQRVSIARALIKNPKIIIADEPTGALDGNSRVEVLSLLQELNERGVTIITITHSDEDASAAKRVIRVEKGEVVQDSLQRKREKFFGFNSSGVDAEDLAFRKTNVLNYIKLNYKVDSIESFTSLAHSLWSVEQRITLLGHLQTDWIADSEINALLSSWFDLEDEYLKVSIISAIFKSELHFGELINKIKSFFESSWTEEASLLFIRSLPGLNLSLAKRFMNFEFFFTHSSDKVRATAIQFFKTPGLLEEAEERYFTTMALVDEDHRMRANVLDHLYHTNNLDVIDLEKFNFDEDSSSRVKAIWAEILIQKNEQLRANRILENLLVQKDKSSILAAVWVYSKDESFDIENFLEENFDKNEDIILHIDSILKTYARAKKQQSDGFRIASKVHRKVS